ncbi:MAG: hypothetical protein IT462_01600 [Planctomycetes bacterium]|nr:hypothetical protein [Planctomycetota bacterium]
MVASRWIALFAVVLSLPALGAQVFSADEFFGKGAFVAKDARKPHEGTLSLPLAGEELSSFVDLSRSGEGRVADCFTRTKTGLLVTPADKESAELELDAGFTSAEITLTIVELDRGGSIALHIKGRGQNAAQYLAEATLQAADGNLRLRVRSWNRGRWVEIPDALAITTTPVFPQTLTVKVSSDGVAVIFSGQHIAAKAQLSTGATCGVAVSDARARIKGLLIQGPLDAGWMEDAAARLQARKTLARLREYATYGLLKGVAAVEHPDLVRALAVYTEDELKSRKAALASSNYAARRDALLTISTAHPKLAAARHEAGVAALLAGDTWNAAVELLAASNIYEAPVTQLAYAESCRRRGGIPHPEAILQKVKDKLPAELKPEWELLQGRLLAAKGEFEQARLTLQVANRKWPEHEAIAAFLASVEELANPGLTLSRESGPLGLKVRSNLDPASQKVLFARLKPYVDAFYTWLPSLGKELTGSIVIYQTPEEYLRAALMVAADNLDNVAGMYVRGKEPKVIACRGFGEDELVRTLVHELWHLAYAAAGIEGDLPAWVNEGMAVYLSAGVPNKDGLLSFDTLPSEFEGMKEDIKKALADEKAVIAMLSAGREKFYLPENLRLNYAVAWVITRYLAIGSLENSTKLTNLIGKNLNDQWWLKNDAAKLLADVRKSLDDIK